MSLFFIGLQRGRRGGEGEEEKEEDGEVQAGEAKCHCVFLLSGSAAK